MGTQDNASSLSWNREREEFILFLVDILAIFGAMGSIMIAANYRDSAPSLMLSYLILAVLSFGFSLERGAIASQIPAVIRENTWWSGPIFMFGFILLQYLIQGTLSSLGIEGVSLLVFVCGFWLVGAGMKRLLVRGRFEQAYRGMVTRAGKKKFIFNRTTLTIWVILIAVAVVTSLLSFIFSGENILESLAGSVVFATIVAACLSCIIEDQIKTHSVKTADVE